MTAHSFSRERPSALRLLSGNGNNRDVVRTRPFFRIASRRPNPEACGVGALQIPDLGVQMTPRKWLTTLVLSAAFGSGCGPIDPSQTASPSPPQGLSRVTQLDTTSWRLAFDGQSFGAAGPYEILIGRAQALANPIAAENAGIVDLDKAPQNAAGLIEYSFGGYVTGFAVPGVARRTTGASQLGSYIELREAERRNQDEKSPSTYEIAGTKAHESLNGF